MYLADMPTIVRPGSARVSVERWGELPGGDIARLFTLRNVHGMRVTISDLGATLVSWNSADRAGRVADVLLGHDTPAEYLAGHAYLGGVIGRWANRIENARFALDDVAYSLDRNEGDNLLHGGAAGFHRALWDAQEVDGGLVLTHESPEGDAGFPGNVSTTLRYTLDDDGTLTLAYEAVSDAPTPLNLTNHACFNLSGDETADIRGHVISIDADTFFEVDAALIPEGRAEVAGHAFDFRASAPLGARLDWPHDQLARAGGFDHCYVVGESSNALKPDDMTEGTYSLTNNGSFGTFITAPVINQPQVAILSIDGVHRRPWVVTDDKGERIEIRPVGILAHSFDHRAVDGAYSGAYLRRVKHILESREWMGEFLS